VPCNRRYDSHQWEWHGQLRMCARCELVDLSGTRLANGMLRRLRELGWLLAAAIHFLITRI
jgi:hypothetical protein